MLSLDQNKYTDISQHLSTRNLESNDLPQLKHFSCGNSSMDAFFRDEAYKYHVSGEGITKVVINEIDSTIIGYYTLKCWMFKVYDSEMYIEGYREIPCIELARLAVCTDLQHGNANIHIGTELVKDLILFIKNEIAIHVGCRLITGHAIRDKFKWYHDVFGFEASDEQELISESETVSMHLDLYSYS